MISQVVLPKLTYEMVEGRILEWLREEGDRVAAGQALFVVETDKASVEVPAELPGTLLKVVVPAGETVPVSTVVAWLGDPGEMAPGAEAPPPPAAPASAGPAGASGAAVSPVARRLARELGVDLADVQAFVGQKRIREADVRAFAEARETRGEPHGQPQGLPLPERGGGQSQQGSGQGESELLALTPLQRAMASHLSRAAAIPQFAASCEVSLASLKSLRDELRAGWEGAHGYRLTFTHLFAALAARALVRCPTLNASWTDEGIRLYRAVHLGVAMASERGLVVPVVRDAGSRSLEQLAADLVRLQRAVEANRLLPADLEGGTFTVTNVGMLGIDLSIPLLNPPQSAILGIGAERAQVRLGDNRLWVEPVAWITVAADHRVVDGAAAAAFLKQLKALIEDPRPALE